MMRFSAAFEKTSSAQNSLAAFEPIAQRASRFGGDPHDSSGEIHAFENRNIHPALPPVVRELFDNAHYAQATFEAFKFIDNEVKRHSGANGFGKSLMMNAFSESSPKVSLNPLSTPPGRPAEWSWSDTSASS